MNVNRVNKLESNQSSPMTYNTNTPYNLRKRNLQRKNNPLLSIVLPYIAIIAFVILPSAIYSVF